MTYKFGNEVVKLQGQKYRNFYVNYLLKLTIFGCPLYSNLLGHEIPYKTKKQAIVSFYSYKRMEETFDFGGLKATVFYKDQKKCLCCPKVNLKTRSGMNIIGYVMDEENDELRVKVEGQDEYICMRRPEYDNENGKFMYSAECSGSYLLSEIWPVRIKLKISGQSSIIMSTYGYVDDKPETLLN